MDIGLGVKISIAIFIARKLRIYRTVNVHDSHTGSYKDNHSLTVIVYPL